MLHGVTLSPKIEKISKFCGPFGFLDQALEHEPRLGVFDTERDSYHSNTRSIPAILTPVKVDALEDNARRSSVSRL